MPRFRFAVIAAASLCLTSATSAWAGTSGFYRQPALRGDNVYLVAEGDLWRVSSQGGDAQRLTTHNGLESQPAVSPDGQWLAFTGQYDGGTEIYLMPVTGGPPKRLTWEGGGMRVWGFSAAGEVIYTSLDARPGAQLFAIDVKTGQRRQLPVAQGSDGALSADGKTLYFTRSGLRSDNARQYRGGAIARLWSLNLSDKAEARPLIAEGNNDRRPLPYRVGSEERIAFLSDRDGTVNLWSVNAQGTDLRQHTAHKGWDIRHASIDGSRVVYALGADLYTVDLTQAAAPKKLDVSLGGDFDQQRQRWIKKPQDFLPRPSRHAGRAGAAPRRAAAAGRWPLQEGRVQQRQQERVRRLRLQRRDRDLALRRQRHRPARAHHQRRNHPTPRPAAVTRRPLAGAHGQGRPHLAH
jgi:tricorn protease